MTARSIAFILSLLVFSETFADEESHVQRAKERARNEFDTGLEVLRGMYRRRIGDLIDQATRVEVYLLDFSFGEEKRDAPSKGMFDIFPYRKQTAILASHTCTDSERQELVALLRPAVAGLPHDGGHACHFPIHGIRVWVGADLAFETSICWYCGNWQMDYGKGAGWENFTDGFRTLKPLILRLMPIPPDEVTRFKRGHDGSPQGDEP